MITLLGRSKHTVTGMNGTQKQRIWNYGKSEEQGKQEEQVSLEFLRYEESIYEVEEGPHTYHKREAGKAC